MNVIVAGSNEMFPACAGAAVRSGSASSAPSLSSPPFRRTVLPCRSSGAHRRAAGLAEPGRDRRHGSAIGRSVIALPGLAADRVKALRDAFQGMVRDPEFIADLQRTNVEPEPLPGAEVEQLAIGTLNAPRTVRERAKLAFGR